MLQIIYDKRNRNSNTGYLDSPIVTEFIELKKKQKKLLHEYLQGSKLNKRNNTNQNGKAVAKDNAVYENLKTKSVIYLWMGSYMQQVNWSQIFV